MTDRELDHLCSDYLRALEDGDFETLERLWILAGTDAAVEEAFHELNAECEQDERERAVTRDTKAIKESVEQHLPTAEILSPATGPVTLAEAAEDVFRDPPARLPTEAYALNDKLRSTVIAIPSELNLSSFIHWMESQYGTAPRTYWKALYDAAIKLDLRRAETEYQMAARSAPKPEEPR